MLTKSIRSMMELSCPDPDPSPVQATAHFRTVLALRSLGQWLIEMSSAIEDRPRDDVLHDRMDRLAGDLLTRAQASLATYRGARDCGGEG